MSGQIETLEWVERPLAPVPLLDDQLAALVHGFRSLPGHLVELVDHLEQAFPSKAAVIPR